MYKSEQNMWHSIHQKKSENHTKRVKFHSKRVKITPKVWNFIPKRVKINHSSPPLKNMLSPIQLFQELKILLFQS